MRGVKLSPQSYLSSSPENHVSYNQIALKNQFYQYSFAYTTVISGIKRISSLLTGAVFYNSVSEISGKSLVTLCYQCLSLLTQSTSWFIAIRNLYAIVMRHVYRLKAIFCSQPLPRSVYIHISLPLGSLLYIDMLFLATQFHVASLIDSVIAG